MNEEERQAQGKFVNAILTACQDIIKEGNNYLQVLGKVYTEEQPKAVSEENFNLNFTEYTSQNLGIYGVAEEKGNIKEKFQRAMNVLKQANAAINNRYHGEGYVFSFWTYQGRIYRQKLKK